MKPEKRSRAAKKIKKEDNSEAEGLPEPKPKAASKKIKKEGDDEAEPATKAKPRKSKAASTKVKAEVVEYDEISADNEPPSKTSGRPGKKSAAAVKTERVGNGEEDEEESEFEEKLKTRRGRGKKPSAGSTAQARAKSEYTAAHVRAPIVSVLSSYSHVSGPRIPIYGESHSLEQCLKSLPPCTGNVRRTRPIDELCAGNVILEWYLLSSHYSSTLLARLPSLQAVRFAAQTIPLASAPIS